MNPSLIIDCSIAMSWCFADELTAASQEILVRLESESALVPSHWFLEVVNVLAMSERRNRISSDDAEKFLAFLEGLNIEVDYEVQPHSTAQLLTVCRSHRLTSYDAAYLELAMRTKLPIATFDSEIRTAAGKVGITVLG